MTLPTLTRRRLLIGIGAVAVAAGAGLWMGRPPDHGRDLSPVDAHRLASAGEIVLVDIRRPEEWTATGIGTSAVPLDMRRPDFIPELRRIAGGTDRAIALICARGVRSNRMSAALTKAGFSRIIDVPEGMLGSRAGPGWLARGLPVRSA